MRSYAPRGQTPVLRVPLTRDHLSVISREGRSVVVMIVGVPLTRDHLSVISGITAAGHLLVAIQARAFKGSDVVRFPQHLLSQLGCRLLIIWDGAPIHHDGLVNTFVAGTAGQLCVEQLPGYAPDLNPDEGVWDQLKYVELRNVTCHNSGELRHELRLAIARLRHKPELIRHFIEHYGY